MDTLPNGKPLPTQSADAGHDQLLRDLGAQAAVQSAMGVIHAAGDVGDDLLDAAISVVLHDLQGVKLGTRQDREQAIIGLEQALGGLRALRDFRNVLKRIDERTQTRAQVLA